MLLLPVYVYRMEEFVLSFKEQFERENRVPRSRHRNATLEWLLVTNEYNMCLEFGVAGGGR